MCKIPDISLRVLVAILAAASTGILGTALVAQYGFGLHPCELCMAQRYPYAVIIALGSLGAFFVRAPKLLWLIAIVCCLLLLVDAAIAGYHAGVELGWVPGPSACTSNASGGETLEDMRREIMNAPLVPCNQPMLQVLGISMAGWNAIAASLLLFAAAAILYKKRRV